MDMYKQIVSDKENEKKYFEDGEMIQWFNR